MQRYLTQLADHFPGLFLNMLIQSKLQLADLPNRSDKTRQMIAVINPRSGRGRAREDLAKVLPIFKEANIQIVPAEIQGAHIDYQDSQQSFQSFFQSIDVMAIDGVIVVGGDGTVHSVVNALMGRPDWQQAIKIPIGILPSGTDNGLCKTVLELSGEPYGLEGAVAIIAQGRSKSLDLFKVTQHQRTFYGLHSLAWGLVSDIDIDSSHLRFLGPLKEWIYGLVYVLRRRLYTGQLSFSPQFSLKEHAVNNGQSDNFIGIWAVSVPWAGQDRLSTPLAKLNDGLIDLLVLRQQISRKHLLEIFLKTEDGSHIHCSEVEYYKTQALKLVPHSLSGIITVDGEAIDYAPLTLKVLPGLCNIFCS